MISFVISLVALILGYLLYGRVVERIFAPDNRPTPAVAQADGVDYIVMPSWKVFMIQFLNIAGTGPIFGAIMGAKFGPAAYLWIVFGCIFAGAVHDYFCGMLSMRHGGSSLPELVGIYLGIPAKKILLVFSIIVLLMVGTVFVYSPALILGGMTAPTADAKTFHIMLWVGIIFIYYILATMLPIDKIIGKIYPIFAFSLLFMAVALGGYLLVKWPSLPEVWDMVSTPNLDGEALFPCLCITIACGAVSGFHATQSPLMARCIKSEKSGRAIFYGAMITEGIVALVWASVSSYFFYDGGAAAVGSTMQAQAPEVVTAVSKGWLGIVGGILAILGVVAAPITSGDTAFRSARLIIADFLKFGQRSIINRLIVAAPLCGCGLLALVQYSRCKRFQYHLALLRVVEPNTCGLHTLDGYCVSGTRAQTLHHNAYPRTFHDGGVHFLCLLFQHNAQPRTDSFLLRWRLCSGCHHNMVLLLAQEV